MPRVIIQPSHHSSQLWDFCCCCTQRVKGSKRFSNAFLTKLFLHIHLKKNTNHQTWFKIFQILSSILRVCPYFCSPLYVPATRFSNPRGIKAVLKPKKPPPPCNLLIDFHFHKKAREFRRDQDSQAVRIKKID